MSITTSSDKKTLHTNRRQLLKSAMLFSFSIAGTLQLASPAAARSAAAPLRVLTKTDAKLLEHLSELLVPGATDAGVSHYIDAQLSAAPEDCLLMLNYLGFNAPHTHFYQTALANIARCAQTLIGKPLDQANTEQANAFIQAMKEDKITDWQGLPASLVYFVLRADAIDVRYGTEAGMNALEIPYMAHITPTTPW